MDRRRRTDLVRTLAELRVLLGTAEAVGLVVGEIAEVAVEAHAAVAVVVGDVALGGVDRQQIVVGADAVAVGVGVGEEPALQHLVRRVAHAGEDVGRVEGGLLDLGEVVGGLAIEGEDADVDERELLVRPDLGEIEGIVLEVVDLDLRA